MTAFRNDLQALVAKHVALAPVPKLLRLVDALDDEQSIAFGSAATAARLTKLGVDNRPLLDPQDGEHVATHDALTGLTWLTAPVDCGEKPWSEAIEEAKKVRVFGATDWRLPTIQELLSIVDYERFDPAVDPDFFKGPYGWVWSSTPAASPSDYAWSVFLYDGDSYRYGQAGHFRVRAVRAGQPLGLGI